MWNLKNVNESVRQTEVLSFVTSDCQFNLSSFHDIYISSRMVSSGGFSTRMESLLCLLSCRYRRSKVLQQHKTEEFFYGASGSKSSNISAQTDATASKSSSTNTLSEDCYDDRSDPSDQEVSFPRFRDIYEIIEDMAAHHDFAPHENHLLGAARPSWHYQNTDEASEQTSVLLFTDCGGTTATYEDGNGRRTLSRETRRFLTEVFDSGSQGRENCSNSVATDDSSEGAASDWDWRC